jgi:cell division protein FtsL
MASGAAARAAGPRRQSAAGRSTAPRRAPAGAVAPARRTSAPSRRAFGRARPAAARVSALPRGARLLDALLTGRLWIGLIGVLLAGIVFFNVDLLQMNREITQMADRAAEIKRQNDRLRHDYARLASSERIQEAAATLGLVYPAAGEVRYLESNTKLDAHKASKRIIAPASTTVPPETSTTVPPETSTTVPPETTTTLPPE